MNELVIFTGLSNHAFKGFNSMDVLIFNKPTLAISVF